MQSLKRHHIIPNLIFYGPPGTGKTSTMLAFASDVNGSANNDMVLELNASDQRDIGVVRDVVQRFVANERLVTLPEHRKMVIFDEADALSVDAQAALTHMVDLYQRHVSFCFICNHMNNLSRTLQSRCTKFRFTPLAPDDMREALTRVLKKENVHMTLPAYEAVLRLSGGDLRWCLNLVQSAHAIALQRKRRRGTLMKEDIYRRAQRPVPAHLRALLKALRDDDSTYNASFRRVSQFLRENTLELVDLISATHAHLVDALPDSLSNVHQKALSSFLVSLSSINDNIRDQDIISPTNVACFVCALRIFMKSYTRDSCQNSLH